MKPGIYPNMSEAEYHSDPAPGPSLSSSIAKKLLFETPRAAREAHPRLNPRFKPQHDPKFDMGRALHALLLENRDTIVVVEADDFRTKAAQAQRDQAYAEGRVPLTRRKYEEAHALIPMYRKQFAEMEDRPIPFTSGSPEVTLIWQEFNGVWCRIRCDWMHDDRLWIDDLKTTEMSANPESYGRYIWREGYQIQEALYRRGVRKLCGEEPVFRFIPCEQKGLRLVSAIRLDAEGRALADAQVERAIDMWERCLERDDWPAYPKQTVEIETPSYLQAQWEAEEMYDEL